MAPSIRKAHAAVGSDLAQGRDLDVQAARDM
jgi:hypothetical protein